MVNKVISIVSGGFDPIHPGHIMMMNDCLDFSDYLIVGVNSNQWLINKKGNFFMDIIVSKQLVKPSNSKMTQKEVHLIYLSL
jgi:cytidyltransferase-like protein